MKNNRAITKKWKTAIVITAVVIVAVTAGLFIYRYIHINQLRTTMNESIADTLAYINDSNYQEALIAAQDAREPALQLRDEEAAQIIDAYTELIDTVIRADEYYLEEDYQSALYDYHTALIYASEIGGIDTGYIRDMTELCEGYIDFFDLMQRADGFAEAGEYESALPLYKEAEQVAYSISFVKGWTQALKDSRLMEEQIALAKWRAQQLRIAAMCVEQGNLLVASGEYTSAVRRYQRAVDIYLEQGETDSADDAISLIDYAMLLQAEKEAEQAKQSDNADGGNDDIVETGETDESDEVAEAIYENNLSVYFDLRTMIDRQDSEPASLIKMGATDNRNEGWYNGCGWIAVYNMLIWMGNPQHPADIVRYFETSGGTVMDGVYGTYPYAIESYLDHLGYNTLHTLFPQAFLSIDSEIKTAGAGILGYVHTSAAHYVAIEYRESDGRYIVYNDSFARARSRDLELSDSSPVGAVIDSVEAWLANEPDILFAFSLITPET